MKWKLSKKQLTWGLTVFLIIIAAILFYSLTFRTAAISRALKNVGQSLMAVVYGVVIAYVMSPTLNFIEERILLPLCARLGITIDRNLRGVGRRRLRKLGVFITMAFLLSIVYALIRVLVPQILLSVAEINENFPAYVRNVIQYSNKYLSDNTQVRDFVNTTLRTYSSRIERFLDENVFSNITVLVQRGYRSLIGAVRVVFNLLVGLIVAVYLLDSKETFAAQGKKLAYAFLKESWANEVVGAFRYVHYTFTGFFTGKILDSIIIGCLCYCGVRLLQVPYPVLLAVFVGVTNIIPFFGPYIGMFAGSVLLVMIHPLSALVFLIFDIVLQQIDGNIIGPHILGQSTGISSFWVIFSIMFFGAVFGPVGWLIGVPLFAVLYAFVRRLSAYLLKKRGLTTDTGDFIDIAYVENGRIYSLREKESVKYNALRPGSSWKRILRPKKRNAAPKKENASPGKENTAPKKENAAPGEASAKRP